MSANRGKGERSLSPHLLAAKQWMVTLRQTHLCTIYSHNDFPSILNCSRTSPLISPIHFSQPFKGYIETWVIFSSKLNNPFLQRHDVALGSRESEIVGRCPEVPFTLNAMKYAWHQLGSLENLPPSWISGGQYLWSACLSVKCTSGDMLETYQWLYQGDNISHVTQTSFFLPRLPGEPDEPLTAAGRAAKPRWSCLTLAVALFPFPWKREDRLFGVWLDVPITHVLMTPIFRAQELVKSSSRPLNYEASPAEDLS